MNTMRPIDPVALRRQIRRLQAASEPPWLNGEIARRMAERIALLRDRPRTVWDPSGWWGASAQALSEALPQARILAGDGGQPPPSGDTAGHSTAGPTGWWRRLQDRWTGRADCDATETGPVDLVWSNLQLQGCAEPLAELRRWRERLVPQGVVLFSTLGPGTLHELGVVHRRGGWGVAAAPLVDMHDLGDMLLAAGFADPVMDQDRLVLRWSSPDAALAEWRQWGGNVDPARHAGLRTPRWRERWKRALAQQCARDGHLELTVEVVFGHAVRGLPPQAASAETRIGLDELRRAARSARSGLHPREPGHDEGAGPGSQAQ